MGIHFERALLEETLYLPANAAKLEISSQLPNELKFEGENKKNILFVYRTSSGKNLSESDNKTLHRLLTALHLTMQDIALLNYHEIPAKKFHILKTRFQPNCTILFGVQYADIRLHIQAERYSPVQFGGTTFISSESIDVLDEVKDNQKSLLWKSLQEIFNLKK